MKPLISTGIILDNKYKISPLAYVKIVKDLAILPPKFKNVVSKDRLPVDLFLEFYLICSYRDIIKAIIPSQREF